jgi:branched-chain amino acid transport system permease protein
VLIYKASHTINFALGELIMFGSLLASTGSHTIGLDLGGAVLFGCVGMALLGVAFNAIVLGRLVMRPVISLIMVTLGLGALMHGVAALRFRGVPGAITDRPDLPLRHRHCKRQAGRCLDRGSLRCLVSWFFHGSRTGIALRAIADDQQAALAAGIDIRNYFAFVWAATGVISVIAGVLWTRLWGCAGRPQGIPDRHHPRA